MKTVVAGLQLLFSPHCFAHQGMACLWHLSFFLPSIVFLGCSAIDTISDAEPVRDQVTIVSSGGAFKLGFFSPDNTTNRYVGIMFNVPRMEAVWVANRDKPLNDSTGILTISESGNLEVLNGKKEILWSSNAPNAVPSSTAQLLDNGNLVLRDSSNGRSVWESFQNPTDILLEGMRIGVTENGTTELTSWRSPSDPSPGSFTFGVNPQRIPELFVWNRGVLFWRSGPWDGSVLIGVPGMGTDYRSLHNHLVKGGNGGADYFTFDYINKSSLFHLQLNLSGHLRGIAFKGERDWVVDFSNVMSECDLYGKCGPNGRCDPKSSPICSCLQGFEPRDMGEWTKGDWSGGCQRKSPLQCQKNNSTGQQGEEDQYLKFTNVKVPDLSYIIAVSEEGCGKDCLKNCSCSAYTFVLGIGCLHWTDNLIDIQQFSTHGSDLYVHVAYSESDSGRSKPKMRTIIASTALVGCLFLTVSLYLLWSWWTKYQDAMPSDDSGGFKVEELPVYGYETIADATDNFNIKNKLGQGGFGAVYKGKLLNGQEIAVKKLSNSSSQGITEFMNEVTLISKLQHRNLVRLLGCCVEREEKMLLYEYLPNKSLDAYLFDAGKQDLLDWNKRSIIIEGISRGLIYLHRDSRLRIIHRDLKASNVLLDEHLNPKISDFGLARIFGGNQYEASTVRVVGTYGYMAPEYALNGKFSEKSDVYSFGVLLLEIIAGKRNTSFHQDEENLSLLGYAWKLWSENEAVNLAFKKTLDPSVLTEIQRCAQVGLLCVQDSPNDRPNMSNVLLMLNTEISELPLPKFPVYTATFPVSEEQHFLQNGLSHNDVSLTEVEGR